MFVWLKGKIWSACQYKCIHPKEENCYRLIERSKILQRKKLVLSKNKKKFPSFKTKVTCEDAKEQIPHHSQRGVCKAFGGDHWCITSFMMMRFLLLMFSTKIWTKIITPRVPLMHTLFIPWSHQLWSWSWFRAILISTRLFDPVDSLFYNIWSLIEYHYKDSHDRERASSDTRIMRRPNCIHLRIT